MWYTVMCAGKRPTNNNDNNNNNNNKTSDAEMSLGESSGSGDAAGRHSRHPYFTPHSNAIKWFTQHLLQKEAQEVISFKIYAEETQSVPCANQCHVSL